MNIRYSKDQPQGYSNRIEKVAIVGAGGQMGKHITEQLLKTGKHQSHGPSSTNTLPEGLRVIRVDYTDDDDGLLVKALQGQQALIITMSVSAPRDATSKLVRAAAKAGVTYVLPNWFGHDPANDELCNDSMLTKRRDDICNEIKSLGVSSYLLLACGFWYEFSLGGGPDRYGFDLKKRSLVLFNDGNEQINTSTWPQCGRAIAKLLSMNELPENEADQSPTLSQLRNSPIYISSFRLSQRDMFESVKRVTGTADDDWTISHESAKQRWKEGQAELKQGNWNAFTKMLYSRMFFPTGDGSHQSSRGLHNVTLDLPIEDLDEYTAIGVRDGGNGDVPWSH